MAGLCGWIGEPSDSHHAQDVLRRMVRELCPFEGSQSRLLKGANSALAGSWLHTAAQLHQSADILIALEGLPRWRDSKLASVADTEGMATALAHGFKQSGPDVIEVLDGTYAVCIVRPAEQEVFIAVDRMGIRPLAYAVTSDGLVFASTTSALRVHPQVRGDIDPQAIFDYLYFSTVPSPRTIYKGCHKLEPAHYLHYRNGSTNNKLYWRPSFAGTSADPGTLDSGLRDRLKHSVARLNQGCTNTAAFLSGGLDSSSVCAVFSEICQGGARSYSIGFDEDGYDEIEYARIAARHFGLDPREYYVTPDDVAEAIPLIAETYDEPFGNSSAIPAYYCAKQARQDGIAVLLAGDGGDELFAGNERYLKQKIFEIYSYLPKILRSRLLEPLAFGLPGADRLKPFSKMRSYIQQAKTPLPDRLESYNFLHTTPLEEIFRPEFLAHIDPHEPLKLLQQVYRRPDSGTSLNRMLYLDWKFTLADNDLRKVNRMCERCGVEVGYPMLDTDLVEFSTQIPPRVMLKGFKLRSFYKHAMRDVLPERILTKGKHGFGLPFGQWLRTSPALKELVNDSLSAMTRRDYIQPAYIERLLHEHATGHASYYGTMVWMLMILERWLQAHSK